MSIQATVEGKYFLKRCTTNALENAVMSTWSLTDLDQMMINVFGRIKVVLCNILKGHGGNDMVEENRGTKGTMIKIESTIRELEKDNDNDVIDYNSFQVEMNEIAENQEPLTAHI